LLSVSKRLSLLSQGFDLLLANTKYWLTHWLVW
jgi:hypothetical protein